MIKWCAYCQEFQGETPEFDNYAISHGLCSACKARGFNISDEEFEKINQLKAIQKILFDAGFSQDAKAVDEAIKTAQAAGVKPVDLLMGLVGPLLWTVGDLWASGKITYEDENRFTTFFDDIIERIETHNLKNQSPGAAAKLDILLMNSPSNFHLLGIRVLNLWLHSKGTSSQVLKGKQSLETVLSHIENLKPNFVGISVALAEQLPAALNFCKKIHAQLGKSCPPLILGGNAVKQNVPTPTAGVNFLYDISQLLMLVRGKSGIAE